MRVPPSVARGSVSFGLGLRHFAELVARAQCCSVPASISDRRSNRAEGGRGKRRERYWTRHRVSLAVETWAHVSVALSPLVTRCKLPLKSPRVRCRIGFEYEFVTVNRKLHTTLLCFFTPDTRSRALAPHLQAATGFSDRMCSINELYIARTASEECACGPMRRLNVPNTSCIDEFSGIASGMNAARYSSIRS